MMGSRLFTAFAWLVGILVSVALMFGLGNLLYLFGIEIAEEEVAALLSPFSAAFIFSLMIGVRCGMAVYEKDIRGGVTDKGEIEFRRWLIGVVVFGFLTTIIDVVIPGYGLLPF